MKRYIFTFLAILSISPIFGYLQSDQSHNAQAALGVEENDIGIAETMGKSAYLINAFYDDSDSLLKLSGRDIQAMFDAPELIRRDLPTTIWQYRTDACVLDVYFTTDEDPLFAPVVHYELRTREQGGGENLDVRQSCSESLIRDYAVKHTSGDTQLLRVAILP